MTATESQPGANGHSAPTDPEALRAEIARTRAGLGHTVEALAAKADVKARAQDAVHSTVETAKERVQSTVETAKLRMREGAEQVAVNAAYAGRELRTNPRSTLQAGLNRLVDSARERPAPWIVGSALLVLAGVIGFRSRRESL
jgi:hypothetical protein